MATVYERSKALWIGGAVVGAIIGFAAGFKSTNGMLKSVIGSAGLGMILLGAGGDVVLEQEQRTGKLSLLPLGTPNRRRRR